MLRFPEEDEASGALESFCLPLVPRKSSLVSVGLLPASTTSRPLSTPAKRSFGNVTISTIRRAPDAALRTPLQRLAGPSATGAALSSPLKALRPMDEEEEEEAGGVGKENVCPRAASKYHFGGQQTLYSSPAFHGPPPAGLQASRRPTVDWDALESIVRSSGPASVRPANGSRPASGPMQSEADEIESLLFSTDMPLCQDIFLGYDDPGSDAESVFGGRTLSTVSARRPRSTSIHSMRAGSPAGKAAGRGRIEVRIRSTRRELPALPAGSHLRKMVLAGDPPTPGRPSSEADEPVEYCKFISKLQADGTCVCR